MTGRETKSGRSAVARRQAWEGRIFALPFILGFLAFWLYPMSYSVYLVFQDWDLLSPPSFVGLDNIFELFRDESIGISLGNTSYYTFIGVPLQLVLALALALLLNVKVRGLAIYRTLFYLPAMTPIVASAIVWLQILHPEFGILNSFLRNLGIEPVNWLFDPRAAKPAFILMTLWGVGPQMVIFLAGLQGVPQSLYEAAEIDGASRFQRFLFITIPMISSITFFNLVVGVIASFQVFTTAFIMTRGGPQNATLFLVLYLYRNGFQYFKMGYASAIAWMLFVIIVAFTVIQFRLASRWVYEEGAPA
ncbi:MAG: sugar ABC transporter permease [Caldilineaceae bacterium SB0666_bin_21]|nr:sugar ABC transporter permease [Caldilineaceae bacterium SB0666_bin_21]